MVEQVDDVVATILLARTVPALLYRPLLGGRGGTLRRLLQTTTLSLPVVGGAIGVSLA